MGCDGRGKNWWTGGRTVGPYSTTIVVGAGTRTRIIEIPVPNLLTVDRTAVEFLTAPKTTGTTTVGSSTGTY